MFFWVGWYLFGVLGMLLLIRDYTNTVADIEVTPAILAAYLLVCITGACMFAVSIGVIAAQRWNKGSHKKVLFTFKNLPLQIKKGVR